MFGSLNAEQQREMAHIFAKAEEGRRALAEAAHK